MPLDLLGSCRRAGEVAPANEHRHVTRVLCEKDALLGSREAASHHEDLPAGEELPVARGAVGHASTTKLVLARKSQAPWARPRGEKDREARDLSPRGAHALDVTREVKPRDLGEHELGTEGLGLAAHRLGELGSARAEHAGVVDHFRRDGDLPAEAVPLHHEHAVAGARQIERGREPRRSATDDHGVIEPRLVVLLAHESSL